MLGAYMSQKLKAVAQCRVSTSKQRLEGTSLEAQERYIYECADYFGAEIVKIWSLDVSSRKGKNLARKDLKEIFEYCKKHKVQYYILDEVDRFMRSVEEYYWSKVEFKKIGVSLAYAKMPEITHADNPMTVFKEMVSIFQAEASNHERITKTNDKMQSRINEGYYPGYCHTGYTKSDVRGLHVPKQPEFSLLQEAITNLANGTTTLQSSLKWLDRNGFTKKNGGKLDMTRFKQILQEPYYYGAVSMRNFKQYEQGLHQAMITKEQFDVVARIARGQKAKFTVDRHNPDFPLNGLLCEDCYIDHTVAAGKFTGYQNHNGKRKHDIVYYRRYHCRNCGMSFTRNVLHKMTADYLAPIKLDPTVRVELLHSLRRAWADIERSSLNEVNRLQTRLQQANEQRLKLVTALAMNPELTADLNEAIKLKKTEIDIIEGELDKSQDIEADFNEFAAFALDFVDNLKEHWWQLDHDDRGRCELLLFPQFLRVNHKRKVSTPEISAIYRYEPTKKTPIGALNGTNGGPSWKLSQPKLCRALIFVCLL